MQTYAAGRRLSGRTQGMRYCRVEPDGRSPTAVMGDKLASGIGVVAAIEWMICAG